jgi:hypothetical protein
MFIDKPIVPFSENDQCLYLFYFPWLQLEDSIQISQLSMLPFPSDACDALLDHENDWLQNRLQLLKQSYLDRTGNPVSRFTLISGPEGMGVSVQNKTVQELAYLLDLALNILNLRYSDYDTRMSGYILNMRCAAIFRDREEILSLNRNWFHESWVPITPVHLRFTASDSQQSLVIPVRRIRELFQALINSSPEMRKRLNMALGFLRLSMFHTTQSFPQICLELLAAAFEHLFEHSNIQNTDVFAFKLEDLWNYPFRNFEYHPSVFKNKQLKQATQIQSFRLAKPPSSKKTWLQAWFLEFFKMRNDLMFNLPVTSKEYAWNLTQHLRIATEILPMTLLILLSRDEQTRLPLKNEDEKRIRDVDAYIQYARSIWYSEDYPSEKQPEWLKGKVLPNIWDSLPEQPD